MKRKAPTTYKKPALKRQNASSDLTTLKKKVAKLEKQPEVKSKLFTYQSSPVAVGNFANATLALSGIVQGTHQDQRVGNSISAKRLLIRGYLYVPTGGTRCYRVLVFNDRQHNNATTLAAANLFGTPNSVLDDNGVTLSPQVMIPHHDMKRRYKILRDTVITVTPANTPDNVEASFFQFDIALNHKIEFTGTSSSNVDVLTNMFQISVSELKPNAQPSTAIEILAEIQYLDS